VCLDRVERRAFPATAYRQAGAGLSAAVAHVVSVPEPEEAAAGLAARARAASDDAIAWAKELPGAPLLMASLERERLAAAGLLAGGLAYRLFFWLVPLGLVFASVLSFWYEGDRASLEDAAGEFGLGGATTRSALEAVAQESHARWYFLVAGILLLGWFTAGVIRALILAHAVAWKLRPGKLEHPLKAVLFFNGMLVAVIVASGVTQFLREQLPGPGLVVTLALVGFYFAMLLVVLDKLPHRARSWRDLLPEAVVVAVGMQALHLVVALYLAPKLGRSSELYGALGAATVILLWLYLVARLIVSGAFLNAMLVDLSEEQE
jgi:membrane protein